MKLLLSYIAATFTGCLVINFIQLILVVIGITKRQTLTMSVSLQNASVICFIFLISYIIEVPGPQFGLKRWQPLALICMFVPCPIILSNALTLGLTRWMFILQASIALIASVAAIYFFSSHIGEKVYLFLESRNP